MAATRKNIFERILPVVILTIGGLAQAGYGLLFINPDAHPKPHIWPVFVSALAMIAVFACSLRMRGLRITRVVLASAFGAVAYAVTYPALSLFLIVGGQVPLAFVLCMIMGGLITHLRPRPPSPGVRRVGPDEAAEDALWESASTRVLDSSGASTIPAVQPRDSP